MVTLYYKKIWSYVIITIFILFFATSSFAQDENIKGVEFINGSIIYGKVVNLNVDDIQIETKDGKVIFRKFNEVKNFIRMEDLRGIRFKDGSVMFGMVIGMDFNKVTIITKNNETVTRKFDDVASFIQEDDKEIIRQKYSFSLGTEISYIKYNEPYVEEKGVMYGIVGSYAYHNKLMAKLEGKFAYGQMEYDGETWGGIPLTVSDIPDYMLELRALLGYDFVVKAVTITPNLGIGYRWLQDNGQKQSNSGYERNSNYCYLPIGIETVAKLANGWSLGANMEFDVFLYGKQRSELSNVDSGYNDPENDQKQGYGARGSISVEKKGKKIGFIIEPYIRYWNVKESGYAYLTSNGIPIGYIVEPNNDSTEIGCKLAVTF
jgi:hypothetical protein